jgi:5''-nucleotidase/2'',3''-cyclic phosphodiesterase and related esterases
MNLKSTTKLRLALLLLLAIPFTNTAYSQKVSIAFTTDVHGAIFPYDFVEQKARTGSLSQVSTYIKELRKSDPSLLLLDNGDMLQGQPTVYYYNFVDTTTKHLQARVMNYMGYNAVTVGNHDLEPGHPAYDRVRKQTNFPWLAANAVTPSGKTYFEPYKVFKVKGKKIAVLGLITPAIPSWLPENIWKGMAFEDMVESAQKWVAIIKAKEKPDAIVGLFHAGVDYTYNNQNADTYKNENAVVLVAQRVKGFDAILCGHDHEVFNKKIASNAGDSVQILNPAAFAKNVGLLTISFDKGKKQVEASVVDVRKVAADADFDKEFSADYQNIKKFAEKKIGTLNHSITTIDSYFGSSAFVDLVHRAELKITNADISIAAPLVGDATLKAGDITVGDMFKLYRYENLLYVIKMSGQEVKDFLEYSYSLWIKTVANPEDGMLLVNEKNRFKNQFYNFDSGAGIIYTVDLTKDYGNRIAISSMANGEPFILTKEYKVAMSSYRGNGGGGLLTFGAKIPEKDIPGRLLYSSDKDLRYLIMMDIMKTGTLDDMPLNTWKFIPEDIAQKARIADEQRVFKK